MTVISNYKFITLTGTGVYPINADTWNSNNSNFIAVIGGGGGGNTTTSSGGGGGAFSIITNVNLTTNSIYYNVGNGGTPYTNGGDSWVNITGASTAPTSLSQGVLAKGGTYAGAGGNAAYGFGTTKYSGGSSSGSSGYYAAGGGAAGPNGNGNAGITNPVVGGSGDAGQGGDGGQGNNTFAGAFGRPGKEYIDNSGLYAGSGGGGAAGILGPAPGGLYGGGAGGGAAVGGQGVVILFWVTSSASVTLSISNWLDQKGLPKDSTHGSMKWIAQNYFGYPSSSSSNYTVGSYPGAIAIDLLNNVWVTNYYNTVTKITQTGTTTNYTMIGI